MTFWAAMGESMVGDRPKPKTCRQCGEAFVPFKSTDKFCSQPCALEDKVARGMKAVEKQRKERIKQLRRQQAIQRDRVKPKTKLTQEAQVAVNAYVRRRDLGKPCHSCGNPNPVQFHAGHYRTTKAASHLRFDPLNIFLQCSQCNSHKSGNIVDFRQGLIDRYGTELVESIEQCNEIRKYTEEELRTIRHTFRMMERALKRGTPIAVHALDRLSLLAENDHPLVVPLHAQAPAP